MAGERLRAYLTVWAVVIVMAASVGALVYSIRK